MVGGVSVHISKQSLSRLKITVGCRLCAYPNIRVCLVCDMCGVRVVCVCVYVYVYVNVYVYVYVYVCVCVCVCVCVVCCACALKWLCVCVESVCG